MRSYLLIIFILVIGLNESSRANTEAESLRQQAEASYGAGDYQAALARIQQAVVLEPANSGYQHLLGKCYGRLAERANPLSAYSLAKKTRVALEKAVELDSKNVEALKDLMEYYRQAPGFLGGSQEKARQIRQKLADLQISPG